MRKELTISLDEEHIDELLNIAEIQSTTLSALIRDIISSYVKSVQQGNAPSFQDLVVVPAGGHGELSASSPALSATVARQGVLITELERRVGLLEGTIHKPFQSALTSPVPDISTLSSPIASPISYGFGNKTIIDSDLLLAGNLSEDMLVKAPTQPVAPVMEAMEMGSMRVSSNKEYSQTEAAVALGVSVSTMRKYIKDEKIPARKVGRSWLIHGRDILAYQTSA